ncbi:uncharacterized protein Bfra_011918 [Botrytis fragariae]|uniref:Uncharacterized protein n=1 Tax=Botrytis fragariae TaxID=1964551 RepID=A0A8H6EEB2_9HELO|nr:uncharacterized protein Bfra_011918 [Botrytis fragariae]KAF5868953.1 hypothetical protein Bfra_011918 [Botrytis fragariae]
MAPKALGTAVVGKVKNALDYDSHTYSVTPNGEDESFLSLGGMGLSGDDNYDTEKLSKQQEYLGSSSRQWWNCSTVIAIISSILAATLLFTLAALLDRKPAINYIPAITPDLKPGGWPLVEAGDTIIVDCGNSPAEALEKGCVWDLMSFSWTHPACYNKNISDEFLELYGPWKWYSNTNKKPGYELTEKELPWVTSVTAETDIPMVWTQEHYHIAHCAYIFKLLHIAAMSGHLVTNEGIGMFHTNHCVSVFLDPERVEFEKVTTRVQLLFGKCVRIRDIN